jgi:hypothetical protein
MSMTDSQLYPAIGLPVFAVLMNIIAGVIQHSAVMARFTSIDTLTGKVIEIDNRLTRLEAILERR